MWTFITGIVGSIIGLVSRTVEHKQKVKEAKQVAEIKAIERLADIDSYAIRQPKKWTRRIVTICILFPYVASFIPFLQPYVLEGFVVMAKYPDWFVGVFIAVVTSAIDFRTVFDGILRMFKR